jgi:hypothetical protein
MQWTLTPDADRTLPADASLTIDLDRIVALASVGHAPILLEYRAIPGYADGTLVVQVERSPLLYTDTTVTLGSTIKIGSTTFTETELKQLKTLLARG